MVPTTASILHQVSAQFQSLLRGKAHHEILCRQRRSVGKDQDERRDVRPRDACRSLPPQSLGGGRNDGNLERAPRFRILRAEGVAISRLNVQRQLGDSHGGPFAFALSLFPCGVAASSLVIRHTLAGGDEEAAPLTADLHVPEADGSLLLHGPCHRLQASALGHPVQEVDLRLEHHGRVST